METEKNDTGGRETLAENEFAEVLVGGQEQDISLLCESEDIGVAAAGSFLGEVDDREALYPKGVNDLLVDPFVGDDSHAAGRG
jgi:hypothetical protein